MSTKHSIKIEDDVYKKLSDFQWKRETFSQAINRLLLLREGMVALTSTLEGMKEYAEWQGQKLRDIKNTQPSRDSQEMPNVLSG